MPLRSLACGKRAMLFVERESTRGGVGNMMQEDEVQSGNSKVRAMIAG